MVEVPKFVQLESEQCRFHEVLFPDQMAQFLLLLDLFELRLFIFNFLLSSVIFPKLDRGITRCAREHTTA